MQKLALAAALAAAVAIPTALTSGAAQAGGGYRHHWRPVVWGDGDYTIVRWANGDCKIWHDDNGPPWGTDWVVLADGYRTWDAAWAGLGYMRQYGRCA
jgi:hypothetical protein